MGTLTRWEGEPLQSWAERWGVPLVEAYDAIDSTNDRLRELAENGGEPFAVVIAEQQTAGRGRGGATWHSPPGSGLWMSVLIPVAPAAVTHLPLLVGLAVARAIEGVVDGVAVKIEWPNDLIVDGLKVGGVLCESVEASVIAGIGVNVRTPPGGFPEEIAGRAGSLAGTRSIAPDRAALPGATVRELRKVVAAARALQAGQSLPPRLHQALSRRDALTGRRVKTEQAGAGVARGIDAGGALLLERANGSRVRVVAGSVTPE